MALALTKRKRVLFQHLQGGGWLGVSLLVSEAEGWEYSQGLMVTKHSPGSNNLKPRRNDL